MTSQNNTDKSAMRAVISTINAVEGFDPEPFAVEYTDLETGETRKRLPVMIQMAWFRLKYPEGKITTKVTASKDCFVATARVYPSYKENDDCYLAEATASRSYLPDKPSVSPREWAQTAAVGIALRNAGFGLQFGMAGEEFPAVAPDELGTAGNVTEGTESAMQEQQALASIPVSTQILQKVPPMQVSQEATGSLSGTQQEQQVQPVPQAPAPVQQELTYEERVQQAMNMPCPIKKYAGKTLGDLVVLDPKALNWVVTKFHDDKGTSEAARLICEYALGQQSA